MTEPEEQHQRSTALQLPEGYSLEPGSDSAGRRLLILKRADGSPVAAFEFSGLGPDPRRIWQIAVEDAVGDSGDRKQTS